MSYWRQVLVTGQFRLERTQLSLQLLNLLQNNKINKGRMFKKSRELLLINISHGTPLHHFLISKQRGSHLINCMAERTLDISSKEL